MKEAQTYKELASVQIGGAICLPIILIGYELARIDFMSAILAVLFGNSFLFFVAHIASKMAYTCQRSTVDNAEHYFGKVGKSFFAIILTFCMCSWFAIQTQVMAQDIAVAYSSQKDAIREQFVAIGIATILVILVLGGIRHIVKLANVAVPLMVLTLFIALVAAMQHATISLDITFAKFSKAFTMVVAAAILAVVDLPTFFRHARSEKDARLATLLTFLVGIPLVELMGVFLGGFTSSSNLLEAFMCLDNTLWKTWVFVFVLLAGATTNNTNLYSAAQALASICKSISCKTATVLAGLFCIMFSACSFTQHLSFVLECMAVSVSSMGVTILAAFFMGQHNKSVNLISWAFGMSMGMLELFFSIGITHIALVDAALTACISVIILQRLRFVYETYN